MSYSTGINYFYDFLGLDQSNFKIFYDFSSGSHTSSRINSIPAASSLYSGVAQTIVSSNGSGLFSGSRNNIIRISGINQSDFSNEYSFLFKFRTDGLSSKERVLFGSLTGTQYKSGFNIGINQANYPYFEYYDNTGPVILTSSTKLAETNILGINIVQNNISINWFDPNLKTLESDSFKIDSNYLLFSDKWNLGGSVSSGQDQLNFSGCIGGFLAFNTSLSKNTMSRLISGFFAYPVEIPAVSGQVVSSGIVGYSSSPSVVYSSGFSSAISNFSNCAPNSSYVQTQTPIFTGENVFPIYGLTTGYYQISPATSGVLINSGSLIELGYDSITYTWKELNSPSTEIFLKRGIETVDNYNKNAVLDLVFGDFSAEETYESGNLNVFLNGVFQVESGYSVTGQFFNSGRSGIADFFMEDSFLNFKESVFVEDSMIYDFGVQQNRLINSYTGSSILNLSASVAPIYNQLYLNGQKLISGVDYFQSGNAAFSIVNGIPSLMAGTTGVIMCVSGDKDASRITGVGSVYGLSKFIPNSASYYLNGVRQPTEHYIEHSRLTPISGKYIYLFELDRISSEQIDDWI